MTRRRWLAPEIVQTSATDCGPASLQCVLEGYGIAASCSRLREACQTDVDGSSISTIGDVAMQLGLEAEEIILPHDHLLIDEAHALPAVMVARLPNGFTHFVVVWRRHGTMVQVMDPAIGRRWMPARRLLSELYTHQTTVPASAWREWVATGEFTSALRRRVMRLGISPAPLIESALTDPTWQTFAVLDAAVRAADAMRNAGAFDRSVTARQFVEQLLALPVAAAAEVIPPGFWSVRQSEKAEGEEECLRMRGAVLLRIAGRKKAGSEGPLSAETLTAVRQRASNPWQELYALLDPNDRAIAVMIAGALAAAAAGVVIEALLFRAILDLNRYLGVFEQRAAAAVALIVFVSALLLLDIPLASGALRTGRRLECRLRLALFEKLPRLPDRYFRSRLVSDMVERSHSTHVLRNLVMLASRAIRAAATLAITAAAMCWLDPHVMLPTILTAILVVAIPCIAAPLLNERELCVRTHSGGLSRFSLDALLGLVPIRAHSAERAVRRQHEALLSEWMRASLSLHRAVSLVESVQTFAVLALTAWIVFSHLTHAGESGLSLLLVFWALSLPVLGQEIAVVLRQAPAYRNVTARLLEPLGSPEDPECPHDETRTAAVGGVEITFEGVSVRIAGRDVLKGIDLRIRAGTHVAVVGASGAGKSTLAGVLLGFHRPFSGEVFADMRPLDGSSIESLRRVTAWVDPAVHLWNRSLLENIRYGVEHRQHDVDVPIEAADLAELLVALPDGLQTELGEGGALVSGGEGQRVRLARALFRRDVRLVVLDEPFRGLDGECRRELLMRSRLAWKDATLLSITHDISETKLFDYVIVIDEGRIIEQGHPHMLAARPDSRYRALLDAEAALREASWSGVRWRRLRMSGGVVMEDRHVAQPERVDAQA